MDLILGQSKAVGKKADVSGATEQEDVIKIQRVGNHKIS